MLIQRQIRSSLDKKVNNIQSIIWQRLNWVKSDSFKRQLNSYDIIDRNQERAGVYVPEYLSDNGEHISPFNNDDEIGSFGFYVKNRRTVERRLARTEIDIIFTVNLQRIYPSLNGRINDIVINDVRDALMFTSYEISEVKTGIDSVFAEFDKRSIKYNDMYPNFVFSFTIIVPDELTNCYNKTIKKV